MARNHSVAAALLVSVTVHVAILAVPAGRPASSGATRYSPFTVSIGTPGDRIVGMDATVSSAPLEMPATFLSPEYSGTVPSGGAGKPEAVLVSALAPPEKQRPIYFTPQELHQRPIPVDLVLIEEPGKTYPDSTTSLSIYIDDKGIVDEVEITATDNPTLAAEFADRFRKTRYVPGKISGLSVRSELRVEVFSRSAGLTSQLAK